MNIVCGNLDDSGFNFEKSTPSFKECFKMFNKASGVCTGTQRDVAHEGLNHCDLMATQSVQSVTAVNAQFEKHCRH